MPTVTGNYFHSSSLRQRYIAALDTALHNDHLNAQEHAWLQSVARPPDASVPNPVRVDQLTLNEGLVRPFELSAALMLSHTVAEQPQVYLFTLASGIERFKDRLALLTALRAAFCEGDTDAVFEYEKVEGDPFQVQMLALVDQQVGQVRQVSAQLEQIPSLYAATTASLVRQLNETLPHLLVDPQTHLLQIIGDATDEIESTPVTQTLAQAAFDDYCGIKVAEEFERRFLDAQGRFTRIEDTLLLLQALAEAKKWAGEHYEVLLDAFWQQNWHGRLTRRDMAIESLANGLRRELYARQDDPSLNAQVMSALLSLVQLNSVQDKAVSCHRLTIKVADTEYPLAGTFLVEVEHGADRSLFWFTPEHRLVGFDDLLALTTHFSTEQGRARLRPLMAIEDQPELWGEGLLQIGLQTMTGAVLGACVDSIISLQTRNLRYALGLTCDPVSRMAMIDDALDVRLLLDPRLRQISAGRWRHDAAFHFDRAWPGTRVVTPVLAVSPSLSSENIVDAHEPEQQGADADISDPRTVSWMEYTQAFDLRAERLRALDNVLLHYAEQSLQHYLCVLVNGPVNAEKSVVQWLESTPLDPSDVESGAVAVSESLRSVSLNLVSFLLECVSGHRPGKLVVGAQIKLEPRNGSEHLHADLFDHMLGKIVIGFLDRYVQRFERSRDEFQRCGDQCRHAARESLSLREDAMRLDLALAKRQARMDSAAIDMARQVMDRPVRALRTALGVPVVEAFSVSLSYDDKPACVLCDTLLLRQPGDPHGAVMLWRSATGWQRFSSVQQMQELLRRELDQICPDRWLYQLGERDRRLLQAYLLDVPDHQIRIHLTRLDGHAIETLQRSLFEGERQDLRQLCRRAERCRFEAGLFTGLATSTELDARLNTMLDALSVRVDNSIFEAMLPSWITSASVADLKSYYEIFKLLYLTIDAGEDFLFDVPLLQDFAHDRLIEQLKQDFPDQPLNPDRITITSHQYLTQTPLPGQTPSAIPAATVVHSESLTEFAINRFVGSQSAVLSVDCADQPHDASVLTTRYVRALVRRLNVGAAYMRLLRQALAPDDANYLKRSRLFAEQLPPKVMAIAFAQMLKGKLSKLAFACVSSVVDMPDGIARESINGLRVILSPLQLIADEGMNPDTASGVYVICPADTDQGPVVLYVIYHPAFTFREYDSLSALMSDIRADESLQHLVLERLEPEARGRYAHGGFVEPHLPFSVEGFYDVPTRAPGPVTLATAEIKGNALQFLFNDTVKVLLDMGVSNSVTNAQDDRASKMFLAALGMEQTLTLLPGKLGTLVTLWQSQTLFRASAASASGHRWGEALSEFSAALGVMSGAREQALEEQSTEEQAGAMEVPVSEPQGLPWSFSWRGTSLSGEQREKLQHLEAHNVALNEMRHDDLLNLYHDKADDTPYAVLAGKVYRVRHLEEEGRWIIVGADGANGPQLALDGDQRWQLDLNMRLRGGGGAVTKIKTSAATAAAQDALIIEATGMPEIRLYYRDRARRIGEAHQQARSYLENCLDNLNMNRRGAALDPRVTRLIGDFFGTATPEAELVIAVERTVKTLFDAVMDPSLSPLSSPRFVVGMNRPGGERVGAFTIPADPQQRVFLTERFFRVPRYRLKPEAAAKGFVLSAHFQAATLIHELSHLVLDTKDIAYLESTAPYLDLLRGGVASNIKLRSEVERLHGYRLSHRTRKQDLFTHFDNGRWRDLQRDDELGFSAILRITGSKTLDEARDVFLTDVLKRSRVMLKNADSVTLLVLELGRHNYVVPSP